jgi:hypothetical protein
MSTFLSFAYEPPQDERYQQGIPHRAKPDRKKGFSEYGRAIYE